MENIGDWYTRRSADAALILAWVALLRRFYLRRHWGDRIHDRLWTSAAWVFVLHVICAFAFVHHGSHDAAWEHTARRTAELTGFYSGVGLLLNEMFTIFWLVDITSRARYSTNVVPRWLHVTWLCFFLFMAFHATVVFETGWARWLGAGGFVAMLGVWYYCERLK